jgi:hypothetical protein
MNTKLTFYCTCLRERSFEKLIFEMSTDILCDSIDKADDILDEYIPEIFNYYGMDIAFDWVILDYREVEEIIPLNLIESFSGHLTFDDDYHYKLMKLKSENYDLVKEAEAIKASMKKPEEEKQKKYKSVWIDLSGTIYYVGFAEHNNFAEHYLRKNDFNTYKQAQRGGSYYYTALEQKGWIRILGWTDPPSFSLPGRITPKQKNSLRDYCVGQGLSYQNFPEILKS